MRHGLPLFLLLALLYGLTFGGHLYSPDEEILFRTTEALATRGCLAIEPLKGFATRPPAQPRADARRHQHDRARRRGHHYRDHHAP